jgi:hypothetical protein
LNFVWLLYHVHEFDDGHESLKLIGAFSSKELAEAALEQVTDQPGFRELPQGFDLSECTLNQLGWTEGFVTIQPGEE